MLTEPTKVPAIWTVLSRNPLTSKVPLASGPPVEAAAPVTMRAALAAVISWRTRGEYICVRSVASGWERGYTKLI